MIGALRSWLAWRAMRSAAAAFLHNRILSASLTVSCIDLAEAAERSDDARKARLGVSLRQWIWTVHFREHQHNRLLARRFRMASSRRESAT